MKKLLRNNIKLIRLSLILGLAVTLVLQTTLLAEQCYEIRDRVLRLHILAHSDQKDQQLLKLKVRDRLITDGARLLSGAQTKEDALILTQSHLEELTAIARQTVAENGYDHPVECRLQEAYFDTRVYGSVTLPAGYYTALQVIIGEGSGANWWCVMFPNLCIPAADQVTADGDVLEQVLTPGQADLVENGSRYQMKFKAVEWFQWTVRKCREWF